MDNLCKHGEQRTAVCAACDAELIIEARLDKELKQAQARPGVTELAELYSGNYGMNEERAREILGDHPPNICGSIYLKGYFNLQYLSALVWWMENKPMDSEDLESKEVFVMKFQVKRRI